MVENISNVIRVLYQHCTGKHELAVYSSFISGHNKILPSCNNRLTAPSQYVSLSVFSFHGFLYQYEIHIACILADLCVCTTVILQWLIWRKVIERRIWASLVPIVGGMLLTSIAKLSFQYIWILCCLVRLPFHIHRDNSSRIPSSWI